MSFDAGLQPERTALAWRRTGLVSAAGAMALTRAAITRGSVVLAVLCVLVALVAAATLLEGTRELARPRGGDTPVAPTLPFAAHATVAVVVVLGTVGLGLVVVG